MASGRGAVGVKRRGSSTKKTCVFFYDPFLWFSDSFLLDDFEGKIEGV